jgi:hypothetical protein
MNTEYALGKSIEFLKELERYCKYGYELPKMYSAAIPDFGAGKTPNIRHDSVANLLFFFHRRYGKLGK